MRETIPHETRTLAADESLEYLREVETLEAEIDTLYRGDREDPRIRKALGRAHHRLGIALKLAGVHAQLAQAEQLAALRADLNAEPDPVPGRRELHLERPPTGYAAPVVSRPNPRQVP